MIRTMSIWRRLRRGADARAVGAQAGPRDRAGGSGAFPMLHDEHADFYRQAIDIAWRFRSPVLAAYHLAIAGLVATALAVVVWIGAQALDRRLPVRDLRGTLVTPAAVPGGRIAARYTLWRERACAVDMTAAVIDGQDVLWPLVTLHRDVGGPVGADRFVRAWQVPPEAAPGPARLRVGWAYACPGNFVQALSPLVLALPDLAFEIVPAR